MKILSTFLALLFASTVAFAQAAKDKTPVPTSKPEVIEAEAPAEEAPAFDEAAEAKAHAEAKGASAAEKKVAQNSRKDSGSVSGADYTGVSANLGVGIPYLGNLGIGYRFSNKLGVSLGYGSTKIDVEEAEVELTMPELLLNYHPFSGSWFIGLGVGKEELTITATEASGSAKIKAEVEATTTIVKTGWTWGQQNGGFWYGIDVAYIKPSSPDVKIDNGGVPTSDPHYQDVLKAVEDYGDKAYPQVTFARFGWSF